MRTAARKDANHNEIVDVFKKAGAGVLDLSQLKECCDVVVTYCGVEVMVEIKDGSKKPSARVLTEGEEKFREYWKSKGGKWAKVETVDQALTLLGQMKRGGRNGG